MKLLLFTPDVALREKYAKQANDYLQRTNTLGPFNDAGFDLYVPDDQEKTTQPLNTYKVDHNVVIAMYDNKGDPRGFYMYPRSSISKTPLRLANSVGIIDASYRGNLIAKVDHIPSGPQNTNSNYVIASGSRLFQVCNPKLKPFTSIEVVDTIDKLGGADYRGAGGFGSTGV